MKVNIQEEINQRLASDDQMNVLIGKGLKIPLEFLLSMIFSGILFAPLGAIAVFGLDAPVNGTLGLYGGAFVAAYHNEVNCTLGDGENHK